MNEKRSCNETAKQWKKLFQLSTALSVIEPTQVVSVNDTSGDDNDQDPFDCSDVSVPPTFELVERTLEEYQKKWEQLDDLKIVPKAPSKQVRFLQESNPSASTTADTNSAGPKRKKHKGGGWRFAEDRLRLPENFDYSTSGPPPVDDGSSGTRVMSLSSAGAMHPTQSTLSYECELWKLFHSIPSAKQLEQRAREGAKVKETLSMQREIETAMAQSSGVDAHALPRLRMADRHGLPRQSNLNGAPDTATIRLEFWKKQLKKNPSPDPNRLVMEFLSEQTLLDVHKAIIDMLEDELWNEETEHSGCFFIEDTFYKHGNVDYTSPILEWMDGTIDKPSPVRRGYLGISSLEKFSVLDMANVPLGDISMRLGYRYYHVCHGDIETAMFLVDRCLSHKENIPYPIIHDVWTPERPDPTCDACKKSVALFAVAPSCKVTDEKSRVLCEMCTEQLKIPKQFLELLTVVQRESQRCSTRFDTTTRFF